ncbi:MAG: cofilin [Geoglossum umbratile]|nr:MAG: cofilin [Geoglossum umbratile]
MWERPKIGIELSDDFSTIVVEETGADEGWDTFREKLVNAKTKNKNGGEGKGLRDAVYDFEYETREGPIHKIAFLVWPPGYASINIKYAASKDALKRGLIGIAVEVEASDEGDIDYITILSKISKGNFIPPDANDS